MNAREWRAVALGLALVGSHFTPTPARAQTAPAPVRHPNILWISTEDLSPRIGAYGDKESAETRATFVAGTAAQ